jgi:hypothetical protein
LIGTVESWHWELSRVTGVPRVSTWSHNPGSTAVWTSVHILKLNFVVAMINDQVIESPASSQLMDIFGAMLPFGFDTLPLVAKTLSRSAFQSLQMANVMGIFFGAVLLLAQTKFWLLTLCVFPFVATSRQLVYSTVFSQIGEVFGFANYGMLLGLISGLSNSIVATNVK